MSLQDEAELWPRFECWIKWTFIIFVISSEQLRLHLLSVWSTLWSDLRHTNKYFCQLRKQECLLRKKERKKERDSSPHGWALPFLILTCHHSWVQSIRTSPGNGSWQLTCADVWTSGAAVTQTNIWLEAGTQWRHQGEHSSGASCYFQMFSLKLTHYEATDLHLGFM